MLRKTILLICIFASITFVSAQKKVITKPKVAAAITNVKDSIIVAKDSITLDTLTVWKIYKETARASYYADKFNHKRMANGNRFDMTKLTAAHKKLPFGTMLKITNIANGKFVIIEITDRGPFVKSREIDLSKRAFMDIASEKGSGLMSVKIEITDCLKIPIMP